MPAHIRPRIHELFVLAAFVIPAAAAQELRPGRVDPDRPRHEETPVPPPSYEPTHGESPPYAAPRGVPSPGVQVNVNANGNNITGDAGNEPSLAVDPTHPNRIAIGWRQFNTVTSNFRQAGWAWSRDSGHTWTFPGVLQPGQFRSDPCLRSDRNGVFNYYSLSTLTTCELFKSTDGGRTWGSPMPAFGGDKAWMAIDDTGGIGNGNIYVAWSEFSSCCGSNIFIRSTNGGSSFSNPIAYPAGGGAVFGTMAVGPNGEMYSIGTEAATFGSNTFTINRSTNARNAGNPATFDLSRDFDMGGGMGFGSPMVNPAGLLGQAQVVVDRSGGARNGWVYALCSVVLEPNTPTTDPMDIHFMRSTDGGSTWSTPTTIGDDPGTVHAYQWFGTISIAPNGRLDVVWNDTRVDADPRNPSHSALFYSTSSNGGTTWTAGQQIGPSWNHLVGFPQQNKIGDYYDMWSDNVGANLAYAATYNNEQDVWFKRIGDYDCNGNGVGDATDIANHTSRDLNHDGIPDECQCLGDIDRNFVIDLSDLAIFLAHFGTCQGQPNFLAGADLDRDNCVTLSDLAILLSGFGRTCP